MIIFKWSQRQLSSLSNVWLHKYRTYDYQTLKHMVKPHHEFIKRQISSLGYLKICKHTTRKYPRKWLFSNLHQKENQKYSVIKEWSIPLCLWYVCIINFSVIWVTSWNILIIPKITLAYTCATTCSVMSNILFIGHYIW